jgi:hypothetical protein
MPASNSPASMSIHEESTRFAITPAMGVFNNRVLFDQHMAQNNFATIRPELAESWTWNGLAVAPWCGAAPGRSAGSGGRFVRLIREGPHIDVPLRRGADFRAPITNAEYHHD